MIKKLFLTFWITVLAVCFLGISQASAATIQVTTYLDEFVTDNTTCSLREAITVANNNTPAIDALDIAGCVVDETVPYDQGPDGADTITFLGSATNFNDNGGNEIEITIDGAPVENANQNEDFDIYSNIIFQGNGSDETIIDGGWTTINNRVFDIVADDVTVTFNDLTIQDGISVNNHGGGIRTIYNGVTINLNNVVVNNNQAITGGGIYTANGAVGAGNNIYLYGSTISNNQVSQEGAAIQIQDVDIILNRL